MASKETMMSPNRSSFIHICSILFEELEKGGGELNNCNAKYFYMKKAWLYFRLNSCADNQVKLEAVKSA